MKLIKTLRNNKRSILPLMLLLALTFIYGCRCEGGIGSFSDSGEAVKTISIEPESK